jgi:ribulose-phosphate 3-epimerase
VNREIRIVPSLLSADFSDLTGAVRGAEAGGARMLHFDMMDGHYVPNITFGPMVVKALRPITDLKFLIHLMIENAQDFVEECAKAGADSITVHPEACTHVHRVIQQIRAAGASAGVALNPATPLSAVEYLLNDIDMLLVMTVNPGFGGQEFIEGMLPKISEARRMVERTGRDIDIAVDGGIDSSTCARVVEAGANVLIAGNAVFKSPAGISGAVRELETCATICTKGPV